MARKDGKVRLTEKKVSPDIERLVRAIRREPKEKWAERYASVAELFNSKPTKRSTKDLRDLREILGLEES